MKGGSDSPPVKFNRSQDHHELYLNLIRWELDDEMENVREKLQNWRIRMMKKLFSFTLLLKLILHYTSGRQIILDYLKKSNNTGNFYVNN